MCKLCLRFGIFDFEMSVVYSLLLFYQMQNMENRCKNTATTAAVDDDVMSRQKNNIQISADDKY